MVPAREPAPPQCHPASRAKADNELATHGQHYIAYTMYVHGSKRGLASPALLQPLCQSSYSNQQEALVNQYGACSVAYGYNATSTVSPAAWANPEVQSSSGWVGHLQQHDMHPSLSAPGRVPAGSKGARQAAKCCASQRRAETALSSHDIVQDCISCATLMRPGAAAAERCKVSLPMSREREVENHSRSR